MRKISFLVPYPPDSAPSQRFRFEFFIDTLNESCQVTMASFYSTKDYKKLRANPSPLSSMWILFKGFLRRKLHALNALNADFIFVHREITPVGPPFFEFFLARIFRKKIIYDFDDAIWLADPHESGFKRSLKWKGKIKHLCRWSYKISCGNHYLAEFAKQYSQHVFVIPTVVDTSVHLPSVHKKMNNPPALAWTGSSTTLVYLEALLPLLKVLSMKHPFTLMVIADKPPQGEYDFITFMPWSKENEASALAKTDIGIMPLPDDPWTRGKCGFKLIQYGAVGLPSVAANVGVNANIVLQGKSGFLCENEEEWIQSLQKLLENKTLRESMGECARKHIAENYSVNAIKEDFLKLFE